MDTKIVGVRISGDKLYVESVHELLTAVYKENMSTSSESFIEGASCIIYASFDVYIDKDYLEESDELPI